MKRMLVASAVALAMMIGTANTAAAAAFVGQLDYTGVHTSDNADLTLATQSTIDLNSVVIASGSFGANGILFGDTLVHASPIVYDGSDLPYTPLWSHVASGISFDLTSMVITNEEVDSITLNGTGTFFCAAPCVGLDPTPGIWNMTLNNSGGVTGSFSSSSSASAVPEPASLALFGIGMFGAAAAARRRRKA